jgi:hypothetical protein
MPRDNRVFKRAAPAIPGAPPGGHDYVNRALQLQHARIVLREAQSASMVSVDGRNALSTHIRNHQQQQLGNIIDESHTVDMDTHVARLHFRPHSVELAISKKTGKRPPKNDVLPLPGEPWTSRKVQIGRIKSRISECEDEGWISQTTATEILKHLSSISQRGSTVIVHPGLFFTDAAANTEITIEFRTNSAVIGFHPLPSH